MNANSPFPSLIPVSIMATSAPASAISGLIENGEIVGRVKDVSLAGNVYELLRNVTAISRETEWVYASLSLPYVLLDGMNVVTKG